MSSGVQLSSTQDATEHHAVKIRVTTPEHSATTPQRRWRYAKDVPEQHARRVFTRRDRPLVVPQEDEPRPKGVAEPPSNRIDCR